MDWYSKYIRLLEFIEYFAEQADFVCLVNVQKTLTYIINVILKGNFRRVPFTMWCMTKAAKIGLAGLPMPLPSIWELLKLKYLVSKYILIKSRKSRLGVGVYSDIVPLLADATYDQFCIIFLNSVLTSNKAGRDLWVISFVVDEVYRL